LRLIQIYVAFLDGQALFPVGMRNNRKCDIEFRSVADCYRCCCLARFLAQRQTYGGEPLLVAFEYERAIALEESAIAKVDNNKKAKPKIDLRMLILILMHLGYGCR